MVIDDFPKELEHYFWATAARGALIGLDSAMYKLFKEAKADHQELKKFGAIPEKFVSLDQMTGWKGVGGAGEKIAEARKRIVAIQEKINKLPKLSTKNKNYSTLRALLFDRSTRYAASLIDAENHFNRILSDGILETQKVLFTLNNNTKFLKDLMVDIGSLAHYGRHSDIARFSINLYSYISAVNYVYSVSDNFCKNSITTVFKVDFHNKWIKYFSIFCTAQSPDVIRLSIEIMIVKAGGLPKSKKEENIIKAMGVDYLPAINTIDEFIENTNRLCGNIAIGL